MEIFSASVMFLFSLALFVASYIVYILIPWSWLLNQKPLPPSPFFRLPLIGHLHLLGRMPHKSFQALAKKHGPVVFLRLGMIPSIVISSPSMAKEVLKHQDLTFASRPYFTVGKYLGYNFMGMALAGYGENWQSLRKLYTLELLTARRVGSFSWAWLEETSYMLSTVVRNHRNNQLVDMRSLFTTFTFNSTTRMLMGKRYFNHQGEEEENDHCEEAEEFKEVMENVSEIFLQPHISEFVPPYLRWIDWTVPSLKKLNARQDKFLQKIVNEHKHQNKMKPAKRDFVDLMLELLEENPRGEDVIKASLTELVTAATETSATTLEWAFAEMLYNARPQVLRKAQEEIEAVVGHSRMVNESDLPSLTYLQAIVKEVFRLHPPVPILLPHMSIQASTVAGYHVPKGSTTFVNVYGIGRDPQFWEKPLEFVPERFVGGGMDVKGQDFELLPFGSGRRSCPGMTLGLRTVHLTLANMIHGFDWKVAEDNALEEGGGTVIWLKKPLKVAASPRLPLEILL